MTGLGIVLGSTLPPVLLPEVARAAEDAGFDSIWLSEDYFMTGGVSGAAIVLGATSSIAVGIGLLPVYVRHPALTAMEAGAIAGAHPGRFTLGFGSGVRGWLDQMGIAQTAPLATMRETVTSVRDLLEGKRLEQTGRFAFHDIELSFPPAQLPRIAVGATGPKMTALAGEVADHLLLSVMSTPAFVRGARARVDEAAAAAGRERPTITALAVFSLAETVAAARAAARPVLAEYLSHGPNDLTRAAGLSDALTELLEQGGGKQHLEVHMPDDWIDLLSITGDAATCRAAVHALSEAGVDEIALMPVNSHGLPEQLQKAAHALELTPVH